MTSFIDDTSLLNELEAVNYILNAGGQRGVLTLVGAKGAVRTAINHLSNADLELQNKGWSWNTIYAREFNPDENGNIALPDNTLSFGPSRTVFDQDPVIKNKIVRYVKRFKDGKPMLFDADTGTFEIDEERLKLELIQRLPFEEIPPAARLYITAEAALRFNAAFVNDTHISSLLRERKNENLITLENAEDSFARHNNHFEQNRNAAIHYSRKGRGLNAT